jgi:hypothetical protein
MLEIAIVLLKESFLLHGGDCFLKCFLYWNILKLYIFLFFKNYF